MREKHKSLEVISKKSSEDFYSKVWPVIRSRLGGGRLIQVEGNEYDHFKFQLDRICGIDAWQINQNDCAMRGLATRVQFVDRPFDTFSIRKSSGSGLSEIDKRAYAILAGGIYPELTVQSYIHKSGYGFPLAVYVCRTKDLVSMATTDPYTRVQVNPDDGSEFYCVRWQDMLKKDYPVLVCGSKVEQVPTKFLF